MLNDMSYEELQVAYNQLQEDYRQLQKDYEQLQSAIAFFDDSIEK